MCLWLFGCGCVYVCELMCVGVGMSVSVCCGSCLCVMCVCRLGVCVVSVYVCVVV